MDELRTAPRGAAAPLAVLASFSGQGGVERMVMNLLPEFVALGHAVDLLLIRADSAHLGELPPQVNVIRLRASHSLTAVPELARYLRRARPPVLLAAKDRAGRAALRARALARVDTRVFVRLGTNLSASLQGRHWLRRLARSVPMRVGYRRVDGVIAVSEGVAEDARLLTGLPPARVRVVRNPVITRRLYTLARAPVDHPFLAEDAAVPVLLGAGRFTLQKDFATLVRAFAAVRAQRPARLIILGEGWLRDAVARLAGELGVGEDVDLPGFAPNPYAYMARAALFVLSSRWEGSPNVLTEAMALGTPVVATDCPSGPREILRGGTVAPLVPVGDVAALTGAMLAALQNPPESDALRAAVAEYGAADSAASYLRAFGLRAGV